MVERHAQNYNRFERATPGFEQDIGVIGHYFSEFS
jgi:hypothetical protein